MVSGSIPCNVNDKIAPMSDAVLSEGPEDHGHPTKVFGLVPYTQRIPPVSLNLLMMLCTVDDEICKVFAISH